MPAISRFFAFFAPCRNEGAQTEYQKSIALSTTFFGFFGVFHVGRLTRGDTTSAVHGKYVYFLPLVARRRVLAPT
ncbi:MAG: hypothetical protein FWG71_11500, partial [Synergistaceae bacterium]|nr:hypothetical protein [Synergistaceae bacterium]